MVRQIGFVDPKKGLPIGFQQSGYIGNISFLVCLVNLRDSVNKKENIILGDIKITEVKDGVVASVPPKGGMGSLITITSAIDESIPKSNDNVNKKREYHFW